MPHLDASALISDDQKGLELLASVLDVPADHPLPRWVHEPVSVVSSPSILSEPTSRLRQAVLVSEAA